MNKKMMLVSAVATMTVVGGVAVAGKKKPKKAKSNVPAAMQRLHNLVGDWKGAGKATIGPDTTDATFAISCREVSDGSGVQCDSTITLAGMGVAHETDLFGWDPHGQRYHWYCVTSMGEAHDHVADAPSGDTFQFVYSGAMEGGPGQEILEMKFAADGKTVQFANRTSIDGRAAFEMTAKMTKS